MKRSFDDINILLVEDNRLTIVELEHTLHDVGFRHIVTAGNGYEALQFLKQSSELPQLIITDLRMPVMGGYEFLQRLAEQEYAGNIIVITGVDDEVILAVGNKLSGSGLNILEFLCKPLDTDKLQAVLLGTLNDG